MANGPVLGGRHVRAVALQNRPLATKLPSVRRHGTNCSLCLLCLSAGTRSGEVQLMLWTVAVVLVILWIAGFLVFHISGALIHLLLVVAAIAVLYNLIAGRR